ncbi:MAG: hypothetical protein WCX71_01805 [Candidatus Buchananbacteria bacterium]
MKYLSGFFAQLSLAKVMLGGIIVFFFLITLAFNFWFVGFVYNPVLDSGQEFRLLANAFLQGRLDINKFDLLDCAMQAGKCFWALGPGPAVLMLPAVGLFKLFGQNFYQGYINFLLVAGVFLLSYLLARRIRFNTDDSLWLALAFCFGSVFLGVAFDPRSWYYSHVVVVFFLFLALYEYFGRKRYWLVGSCLAMVAATRLNAGLGIIFFILNIFWNSSQSYKKKFINLAQLLWPVMVGAVLLGLYNYYRFGNILDTGYTRALVDKDFQRYWRDNFGLFNFKFILTNFYYYFLKLPEPILNQNYSLVAPYLKVSPMGLSFFLISPIFFRIFKTRWQNKEIIFASIASGLVLLTVLAYFNCGFWQFGPRYMLDLLPFWFLILLYSFKNFQLTSATKMVIGLSAFFNLYLYLNLLIFYR